MPFPSTPWLHTLSLFTSALSPVLASVSRPVLPRPGLQTLTPFTLSERISITDRRFIINCRSNGCSALENGLHSSAPNSCTFTSPHMVVVKTNLAKSSSQSCWRYSKFLLGSNSELCCGSEAALLFQKPHGCYNSSRTLLRIINQEKCFFKVMIPSTSLSH